MRVLPNPHLCDIFFDLPPRRAERRRRRSARSLRRVRCHRGDFARGGGARKHVPGKPRQAVKNGWKW